MRFETVRAHPFGPFRDETLRFAPGMNVVYGPNEAGKSTWHAALYAGLCGMRRGRGASAEDRRFRDRHRPWDAGGAWAVSAVVALEDGRRVELRQDLATKIDCRASDADRAGRDYTNEILHDGAPDGSRWLGLNRKTFVAASSVRQAQILGLLDDPGALQEDLQRAAATAGTDETAARALDLLDHYRREQVGSAQARSRPLRLARDRVAEARAAVERARRSQAAYRDHAARVERLEGEAESGEERLAALRAARAEREAAEAERRAARAAELAALFPDGPPRRADDDRVAERAAAALATWRARPTPRPLSGPAVEALERELDAAAEPDGSEPAPAAGAGRAWAPYLAGAAMVAGIALALADSQVAALVAAGLGLGGIAWWWLAARRGFGPGFRAPEGSAAAERRRRLRDRIDHRREADRRYREDIERCEQAEAALRVAAEAAGVTASGPEAQVDALANWQRRRREAEVDVERRGAQWDALQQLLAGQSLDAIDAAARKRRADATARAAGLGAAALETARAAPLRPDELAASERDAAAARAAAHTDRGRLEQLSAGLPSLVEAEEAQEKAARELARVEQLDRTLATTIGFLERAEERVHRDVAPVLRATVCEWLPRVTGDRYTDCKVDPESLQVEVRGGDAEWRRADLLSHGTAEQVYLLLRLALARHLTAPGEVCPVILDDAVAACDAERKRALLETLHAVSASAQVILFTHEEDVRDWAAQRLLTSQDRMTTLPPANAARERHAGRGSFQEALP